MVQTSAPIMTYEEAMAAVLHEVAMLGTERVPVEVASGRILARELVAPFDLPRFTSSSVDGYAVHATDWERSGREGPVLLSVLATLPAGSSWEGRALPPGCAVRVFTGSPVPPGAGVVIRQEDAELHGRRIWIRSGGDPRHHIRERGGDIARGELLAGAPVRLTPPICALASSFGITEVDVYRRARVGILITGSELVPPGRPIGMGEVYDSNATGLAAVLRLAGTRSLHVRRVPDDLAATREALDQLLSVSDVLITSGGASVGDLDLVREAVAGAGIEVRVHGVSIKPGRPFFFGVRSRGADRNAVFGLPGNPLSALVTCVLFAHPYLRAVQHAGTDQARFRARLECPVEKRDPRLEFVPASARRQGEEWLVRPLERRASHMLAGLARANALLELTGGEIHFETGQLLNARFLPWAVGCHE